MLANLFREEGRSASVLHFNLTFQRTGNLFGSLSLRTSTPTWLIAMLHSLALLSRRQRLTSRCHSLKACGPPRGGNLSTKCPLRALRKHPAATVFLSIFYLFFPVHFVLISFCLLPKIFFFHTLYLLDVDQQSTMTSIQFLSFFVASPHCCLLGCAMCER